LNQELFDRGQATRRELLRDAYVQSSLDNADVFTMPMQDMVPKYCWGDVWNRPGLERSQRSLINLAMLSVLNRRQELKAHIHGAIRNGVTQEQTQEVFLQVSIYCGVRAGLESFRIAREVLLEIELDAE